MINKKQLFENYLDIILTLFKISFFRLALTYCHLNIEQIISKTKRERNGLSMKGNKKKRQQKKINIQHKFMRQLNS